MNPTRRKAMIDAGKKTENLISPQETLKLREDWKYSALREALGPRPHEFEFKLDSFIYDLALFDTKTLVEFDGPEHCGEVAKRDKRKDAAARKSGWCVVRRKVKSAEIIHPEILDNL
jgi:very-short-patch-repair endonuclease